MVRPGETRWSKPVVIHFLLNATTKLVTAVDHSTKVIITSERLELFCYNKWATTDIHLTAELDDPSWTEDHLATKIVTQTVRLLDKGSIAFPGFKPTLVCLNCGCCEVFDQLCYWSNNWTGWGFSWNCWLQAHRKNYTRTAQVDCLGIIN